MATNKPLPDDAIRDILVSHAGHSAMGRKYGRSHQTITQIRYGDICRSRCPEIPRWVRGETPTCQQCLQWSDCCTLGFPDPIEEGLTFARECLTFQLRQ